MRTIRIVDKPDLPPYQCFKCLASPSSREYFIDIGCDTNFDGTIYLCDACMKDLGEATHLFMTKERSDYLLTIQQEQITAYKELITKVNKWKDLFEILTGESLEKFFDNMEKVQHGLDTSNGDSTETDRDITGSSGESKQDNRESFVITLA